MVASPWAAFWHHLAEMMAVMVIGMVGAGAIFLIVIQKNLAEAVDHYPTQALLVEAVGMTAPMVAWMRHRGHDWRDALEMGAVMALPVIPFLLLVWFDVTKTAPWHAYCGVSCAAMVALMLYRRDVYTMNHHARTDN
jgi:flagellar biosynthetic protein FliP